MPNRKLSFLVLVSFAGIFMMLGDFMLFLFFGNSLSLMLTHFTPAALIFLITFTSIMGANSKCFNPIFFHNCTEEGYSARLKKIGAVPIKMIATIVFLHTLFLGAIFFRNDFLNVDPSIRAFLILATFSYGIFVGTFLYVMGDSLIFKTLLSSNLTSYPRSIRENRQELKFFIIPIVVAVMCLLFGSAVTLLGLIRAGVALDKIGTGGWFAMQIPTVAFFIYIILMAIFLKRNLFQYFSSLIKQMENLSSDRKDLTQRVQIVSVDELGTIAGMVNTMCDHLSKGILDIKGGQKELSSVGARLEENAFAMADSTSQINGSAEHVLTKTKGQMESVDTATKAVSELANLIGTMEESLSSQTSSMTVCSSAVEEMVGNISSIGALTEKMANQFKTVSQSSEEGSRIQNNSKERILKIVEQSQALLEANKIIAKIAAQTNLLAINAAIEAAHAGEAGFGFSVVAGEIRKLAENSSTESRKISADLKEIVETIEHIVKDAEASGYAFAEVSRRIEETEKLVTEVDYAIQEQKTGAGQVMESLKEMNDINSQVSDYSCSMTKGNEIMLREIHALHGSAAKISSRMAEVSEGIKKINSGAQEVSNLAAASHSSIGKISDIADSFRV